MAPSARGLVLVVRGHFDPSDWDEGAGAYRRRLVLKFDLPVSEAHTVEVIGIPAYEASRTEDSHGGQ